MYRIILSLFLTFVGLNASAAQGFKTDFDARRDKILAMNFKQENMAKIFAADLEQLQEFFEAAKAMSLQKTSTAHSSRLTVQMAIELSYIEQIEAPVANGFSTETCSNAIASNDTSYQNLLMQSKIKAILNAYCKN